MVRFSSDSLTLKRQAPLIVFRGSSPLATALSLQQLALFRIQATLIGLLVAMGISMVWPVRAAVLLRNQSTSRALLVPTTQHQPSLIFACMR
jgi:hypothetical protein